MNKVKLVVAESEAKRAPIAKVVCGSNAIAAMVRLLGPKPIPEFVINEGVSFLHAECWTADNRLVGVLIYCDHHKRLERKDGSELSFVFEDSDESWNDNAPIEVT